MTEIWIINGHYPTCAYIRSLDFLDNEESCDCAGWDDDDDLDGSDYYVDGDTDW